MKELLIYFHNKLVDCLEQRGATWVKHKEYAARVYSVGRGGCYLFDTPNTNLKVKYLQSVLNNFMDINAFLTVGNNAPLSVNDRPIIWARFMEIGEIAWVVVINSDHELYESPLRNSVDFAPATNPIIIAFVLKTLLPK